MKLTIGTRVYNLTADGMVRAGDRRHTFIYSFPENVQITVSSPTGKPINPWHVTVSPIDEKDAGYKYLAPDRTIINTLDNFGVDL